MQADTDPPPGLVSGVAPKHVVYGATYRVYTDSGDTHFKSSIDAIRELVDNSVQVGTMLSGCARRTVRNTLAPRTVPAPKPCVTSACLLLGAAAMAGAGLAVVCSL